MVEKEELNKAISLMEKKWDIQSNLQDKNSQFIYEVKSVEKLLSLCEEKQIDKNYALHRWYNFNCAKWHEYFFCQHAEVRKEGNRFHKTIDFYINNVPFDLKSAPFPKKIKEKLNLKSREDKNKLILWLYEHQSTEGRQHFDNRLFIICKDLKGKSDFEIIKEKISGFIAYSNQYGFNCITINNRKIFSDIIYITHNQ